MTPPIRPAAAPAASSASSAPPSPARADDASAGSPQAEPRRRLSRASAAVGPAPLRERALDALRIPPLLPLLGDQEVLALAGTNRELRTRFSAERDSRQTARELAAAPVASGAQWRQRLGPATVGGPGGPGVPTVHALPPHLQAAPLVALGGRLLALPAADRPQAIRDFLAFAPPADAPPLLQDLRQAALGGERGLAAREDHLVAPGGAARQAVEGGENIVAAMRRLGLGGEAALQTLVAAAMPRAQEAVDRGEPVPSVARRLGISTAAGIQDLQRHVTRALPPPVVRLAIEAPDEMGARFGIQNPVLVGALQHQAALRAIALGSQVGPTAQRFGISAPDAAWTLEPHAARTAGDWAVRGGQRVVDVVGRLGITQPALVLGLERVALDLFGAAALRQGGPVEQVADRLGVQAPESMAWLREIAAGRVAPAQEPAPPR